MAEEKGLCVLADGSGSCFQSVVDAGLKVSVAGTNNPGCYAMERAENHGIPHVGISPKGFRTRREHEIELEKMLSEHDFGAIVMLGDERLKTAEFVEGYARKGIPIFNTHPAPAPQFRGLNGYAWALGQHPDAARKNEWTCVTFHVIDAEMDRGMIVAQAPVPMKDGDTVDDLKERGLKIEHQQIVQCLGYFLDDRIKFYESQKRAEVLDTEYRMQLSDALFPVEYCIGNLEGKVRVSIDSSSMRMEVAGEKESYSKNLKTDMPPNLLFTYAYRAVKEARQAGRDVDFTFDGMNIHPIIMKSDQQKGEKPY